MSDKPPPSPEEFDDWYAAMAPAKDEIAQRHLGLPPDLLSSSLLPWNGIAEVTAALRLAAGGVVVDLACGRGGYGIEVAKRTGARVIGVDFSAEAVRLAGGNAAGHGLAAEFHVGRLDATGLGDASADGIMCVDAIQFADPAEAAFGELHRILRPGGRVAVTTWEPVDRTEEWLPARLRVLDLHAGLTAAGFAEVTVDERAGWLEQEMALWTEAAALDPGDDASLRSLHDEAVRVLGRNPLRRVLATAARP